MACPNCHFHVFAVPVYCPSCGILLLTPDHISRTKFHLTALQPFKKVLQSDDESEKIICSTCCASTDEMFLCPKCESYCCSTCNKFIHEVLNRCPTCTLSNVS